MAMGGMGVIGPLPVVVAELSILFCCCLAGRQDTEYSLLKTPKPASMFKPRPGGDFAAAGNNLFERQNTAAENAFHRLSNLRSDSIRRKDIVSVLEPVIDRDFGGGACKSFECDKGWRDVEQRQADLVYMSSLVDLSTFPQRMYIDGGARQYSSSIGGWFLSAYPQASFDNFKIFAFEMDKLYEKTYIKGTPVKFMPYALWITDTRIPMYGSKMKSISGKHEKVTQAGRKKSLTGYAQAVNFESWLLNNVSPDDFVVVKLDIEGAEHEIMEKLLESSAIHLIDELFMECHYNAWSKMRMDKNRSQCVQLVENLRSAGIVAHEWF